VIITEDGPCMVETGARMHGLKGPKMLEYATGLGTHELAVDVAVNGARLFNDLHSRSSRYLIKKFVSETILRSSVKGVLVSSIDIPEIRALPSVIDVFPAVHPGDDLQITVDLATSPGVILQCHAKNEVLQADVQRIRDLESSSLYKVKSREAKMEPTEMGIPKQQGCFSQLWQICCRWCSAKQERKVALDMNNSPRSRHPAPSPSVMSPVHDGWRRPATASVDLDPSTDIEDFMA